MRPTERLTDLPIDWKDVYRAIAWAKDIHELQMLDPVTCQSLASFIAQSA